MKNTPPPPNNPKIGNGLVQLIRWENTLSINGLNGLTLDSLVKLQHDTSNKSYFSFLEFV